MKKKKKNNNNKIFIAPYEYQRWSHKRELTVQTEIQVTKNIKRLFYLKMVSFT